MFPKSRLSNNKPNVKFSQEDVIVLFGLIFLVMFLFLTNVDSLALFDPDEPRYAATAKDMIEDGNWIVPYFNGSPRLNKPPLFYWLTALSFKSLGISEFSARLPSILFGIGGVVIAFLWARSMWCRWKAFCVGIFLSVCPLYFSVSRLCITDMTMSFFLYMSLYYFYIGYERGGHNKREKITIFFAMAMMFLVKGHVGVLIFMLVICVFLLMMRDIKYLFTFWYVPGIVVFAAFVLPWGFMFLAKVGVGNVIDLLSNETYGRFVGGYQHPEPFYFYANVFFFGFFPWSFFVPLVFLFSFIWRKKTNFKNRNKECDTREQTMRIKFFAVWLVVVIVFFSVSSSKLFTYVLPMAPTVPFLFVSMFSNVEFKKRRLEYVIVLSIFILLFVFSIITLVFLPKWISAKYLTSDKIGLMLWLFCIFMAITVAVFITKGMGWANYMLGFTTYNLLLFLALNAHTFMGENRSTRNLVKEFLPLERESYVLLCYRKIIPSLVFYSGGTVERIDSGEIDDLHSLEVKNKDLYIYMKNKDYRKCKNKLNGSGFNLVVENDSAVILKKDG